MRRQRPSDVRRWAPIAAAAALYASAVAHSQALPEAERVALYEAHARACGAVGAEEEARPSAAIVLAHLRQVGDDRRLAEWLSWCARSTSCTGPYIGEGRAFAREAVDLLSPFGETPELAEALGAVAGQSMTIGPVEDTIEFSNRSLQMAERFGDADLAQRMMTILGSTLGSADDEYGLELLRRALAAAQVAESPAGIARAANNLAATLDGLWRPLEAVNYVEIAYRVAVANELVYHPAFIRQEQALAELLLGRWDAAMATALSVIADQDLDVTGRSIALANIAQILIRRGEPGVEDVLAEAELHSRLQTDLQVVHPVRVARAEASWFDGDLARANDQVRVLIDAHRDWNLPWRLGELALWCWRLDVEFPIDRPFAEAFAHHIAGRYAEAATAFEARHCPYEAADALGDSTDENDLRRSLEILHELGAMRRAAQVAARLRQLGVLRIPRGPRATTRSHGAGLTAREAEVAGLLADGLTNADIAERLVVSPKTVDHHVTAVLAKLGVKNRRSVSAALDSLLAEHAEAI